MIKSISTAAGLLLLVCGIAAAQVKPDGEQDKLAGPVRSIRTEFSKLTDEYGKRLSESRILVSIATFDTIGNRTETASYEKNGLLRTRTLTSYNAEGVKTASVTYEAKDKVSSKATYKIDDKGRVAESSNYDNNGTLTYRTVNFYDEGGRLKEQRSEETEGATTKAFKYDTDGRLIETSRVNGAGELTGKTNYAYSTGGTRVEYMVYKDKTVAGKTVRNLDAQKRKAEIAFYRVNGARAWIWNFSYDERDNVIGEEFSNDLSAAKSDYSYEFDQQGNWVKRTESQWYRVSGNLVAVPFGAHYRTISYYPQPYTSSNIKVRASEESSRGVVTGGVLQGSAIRRVPPSYPGVAKKNSIGGSVVVEITVDEEGSVTQTRPLSGPPVLRDAAEAAAREWKFRPTLLSGVPVKVIGTLTFNFNL